MSASNNEVAVISTTQGELVVEFWSETAPKTVENFKKLANDAFYDGTCFHRIVKGFMIQGGDPLTKDPSEEFRWGTGDPGYKIEAEFSDRPHNKGVLSMARSSDPDSAGSQFFICLAPANFLDGQYTCFGELIKGEEVLDTLGAMPCGGGGKTVVRKNAKACSRSPSCHALTPGWNDQARASGLGRRPATARRAG